MLESDDVSPESNKLQGLCAVNPQVALLKDLENVVVLKTRTLDSCVVISGGNGGLEPFPCGFVGRGLLHASIQGSNGVAPPVDAILKTIRELNCGHMHGCVVITQGTKGNILSFSLACARAETELIRLKMLPISDGCAETNRPDSLSGVVLCVKIAGAMSDLKETMTDIHQFLLRVNENIGSSLVLIDRSREQTREKCICKQEDYTKENWASILFYNALDKLPLQQGDSVIFLLGNNTLSKSDEWFLVHEIRQLAVNYGLSIKRFFSGAFVAPPKYRNVNLTCLKVFDQRVLEFLDHPCNAPGWNNVQQNLPTDILEPSDGFLKSRLKYKQGKREEMGPIITKWTQLTILTCLNFACSALISCQNQLNSIDLEHGDGDAGTRFFKISQMFLHQLQLEKIPTEKPFSFFDYLATLLERQMGGVTGLLYGILMRSIANSFALFPNTEYVNCNVFLVAFERGVEALKMPCVDQSKTMYEPLRVFATKMREKLDLDPMEALVFALGEAENSIDGIRVALGGKYSDAGAHAVGIWLRAVVEGIKLNANK